jgi:hypothetical protein
MERAYYPAQQVTRHGRVVEEPGGRAYVLLFELLFDFLHQVPVVFVFDVKVLITVQLYAEAIDYLVFGEDDVEVGADEIVEESEVDARSAPGSSTSRGSLSEGMLR